MSDRVDISVIVPAYNELENLKEFLPLLNKELVSVNRSYEIIVIDDGSIDGTAKWIREQLSVNNHLKFVKFRINNGKSSALQIGFDLAKGEFVITMDADLQDDPKEIPKMLSKIEEGYDVVSCWKENRQDPVDKTLPSKIFNSVVSKFSGVKLHDMNCGFKIYRKKVVKTIKLYGELHRFVPVLASWQGFTVTEVPVLHHPRKFGKSKFGAERLFKGFFDFLTVTVITRFRVRPLHLFGSIGLFSSFVGFMILLYMTILWFLGLGPIGNRPLFFLGILLLFLGIQFFTTGFIADMIVSGWFYNNKEIYPIEEIYGISVDEFGKVLDKESDS